MATTSAEASAGQVTPKLIMKAIGAGATFLMFAVLCVIAFSWVRVKVPETKGKSLEQIQQAWAEHDKGLQAPHKPAYATD